MVEITVRGRGQLQCTETDIVQSFIIDAEGLVGVLNQLMDGQGCVVGFYDGVGYLEGKEVK